VDGPVCVLELNDENRRVTSEKVCEMASPNCAAEAHASFAAMYCGTV